MLFTCFGQDKTISHQTHYGNSCSVMSVDVCGRPPMCQHVSPLFSHSEKKRLKTMKSSHEALAVLSSLRKKKKNVPDAS